MFFIKYIKIIFFCLTGVIVVLKNEVLKEKMFKYVLNVNLRLKGIFDESLNT